MFRSYRKPDPKFYLLACERNNLSPGACVFLDDLGMYVSNCVKDNFLIVELLSNRNLRVARTLGMETIRMFNYIWIFLTTLKGGKKLLKMISV